MNYFLIAREGFSITEDRFMSLLRSQWPSAKIARIENPEDNHCIEFEFEMAGSPVQGALSRDGSTIIYFSSMPNCARFALWYQEKLPESCPLLLCDEGNSGNITLQPATSINDILQALGYLLPM